MSTVASKTAYINGYHRRRLTNVLVRTEPASFAVNLAVVAAIAISCRIDHRHRHHHDRQPGGGGSGGRVLSTLFPSERFPTNTSATASTPPPPLLPHSAPSLTCHFTRTPTPTRLNPSPLRPLRFPPRLLSITAPPPTPGIIPPRLPPPLCARKRGNTPRIPRRNPSIQVREFLDTALLYADSVAIAVGSPPPPLADAPGQEAEQQPETQSQPQESLLRLISGAAREVEEAFICSGGRHGEEEGGHGGGAVAAAEGGGREGGAGERAACVSVFEVAPWGSFTPALNALLGFASRDGAELVMFQVSLAHARASSLVHCDWRVVATIDSCMQTGVRARKAARSLHAGNDIYSTL